MITRYKTFEKFSFLFESESDVDWDLVEMYDEIKTEILTGFLGDKKMGVKEQPWEVVPFLRLKKIWEDYMKIGFIRDERGLSMIDGIIQKNIIKLWINTELVGHTSINPDDDFEMAEFTEEDKEDFYDYVGTNFSDYAFDDFGGRRLGLLTLLSQLRKVKSSEEKIVIIDKILNVTHQMSDLASLFIEGGSFSLNQLSGVEI